MLSLLAAYASILVAKPSLLAAHASILVAKLSLLAAHASILVAKLSLVAAYASILVAKCTERFVDASNVYVLSIAVDETRRNEARSGARGGGSLRYGDLEARR